jgi:hypothetical protein
VRSGANTINVQGADYLLVHAGGEKIHLVAETGSEAGRSAVLPPSVYGAPFTENYDPASLLTPRWSEASLCGQTGYQMTTSEAGAIYAHDGSPWLDELPEVVPTCERCLAILDRSFPAPERDERFDAVVTHTLEQLELWGCANISDVPADQSSLMRRHLRLECRRRGWKIQSFYRHGTVFVLAPDAPNCERQAAIEADTIERMNTMGTDVVAAPVTWRFSWRSFV